MSAAQGQQSERRPRNNGMPKDIARAHSQGGFGVALGLMLSSLQLKNAGSA